MDETKLLYYKQLQNEEKLAFLFENLDIGIFILNSDLEVVLANGVTEKLFASPKNQQTMKSGLDIKK